MNPTLRYRFTFEYGHTTEFQGRSLVEIARLCEQFYPDCLVTQIEWIGYL